MAYMNSNKVPAGDSSYDHDGEDGDHSVIRKIVEEHGLAKAHTHHKDGDHSVATHHVDGHTHVSNGHPTYSHAHEHIGIAHGVA